MPKIFGKSTPMRVEQPLVIMFHDDAKNVVTRIHPPDGWTEAHYGLLICDLARHVSHALKVDEDRIWDWVDKERGMPTTEIKPVS